MALKTDRYLPVTDISYFMNEVAERGGVAVLSTGGSGAAMDQSVNLVTYAAVASGKKPVGLLLNDMVNKDLTRTHINWHRDEVQKGGKVTILKRGYVVTNMIDPGVTPAAGDMAYVGPSGLITNAKSSTGGLVATPYIGDFMTSKDEDGYAKVEVNLPAYIN